MVPAENLPKKHYLPHGGGGDFYGCCGGGSIYRESFGLMSRLRGYDFHTEACLGIGSDLEANDMDEDESRTNNRNEAGSNSKDNIHQELELERDEGWLQLSIGGQDQPTIYDHNKHEQGDPTARRGELFELDLLPGGSSQQPRPLAPIFHMPEFRAPPPLMHSFSTSLFYQHQQQGSSSMFRPIPQNIPPAPSASSSSSSSSSLLPFGSYFGGPFQVQSEMHVAGPTSDVTIIDPPRRPHSGIWFVLQASQNQAKEPFLPQIPKSYLRIKDGKMTVQLLMKYLVNKLVLESESEVEITCRRQQLQPCLTLQQVRDEIWSSRDAVTLLPHTSTADHLMVLHYGRSPNSIFHL
ncbi:somatic embryoproteinsis receptor kinase 1-like [Hibiscus syriacus]|uniref:Somatic embryoproteinsis receptor kinase 1-like n=1 Tax=Hibiscus syriacus TaxID=106335 RepID=A0A6A3BKS2_HIBSY|nr:protein LAX PANICLE 2-like [Hibiscus syriacus]KAE8716471.1 somatic embryoproteinsis receptor kinase 1-like [Hibiscus syriacus]